MIDRARESRTPPPPPPPSLQEEFPVQLPVRIPNLTYTQLMCVCEPCVLDKHSFDGTTHTLTHTCTHMHTQTH